MVIIKSPPHYTRGKIEVWDFIRDQGLSYHLGNAVKYICRAGYKPFAGISDSQSLQEAYIVDLKKSIEYLQNELSHVTSASDRVSPRILRPEWGDAPEETEVFDR